MIVSQELLPAASTAFEATGLGLGKGVIGLNLCPFAKSVYIKNQVRFAVSGAKDVDTLHADLVSELHLLQFAKPDDIDTTVLIHPWVLADFFDYNDFVGIAEETLAVLGLEGVLQIASFHPCYQFSDTTSADISNCTNRSPFPLLHLLRETSIDRAVAAFPNAHHIFEKNIQTLRRLGKDGWNQLSVDWQVATALTNNEKQ